MNLTAYHRQFLNAHWHAMWASKSKLPVSNWCVRNLVFNEPENSGPFSLAGREYIREPLDMFADPMVSDMVEVFGSQAGKTGMLMGGMGWTIIHNPIRCMWVMPNENKCRGFSKKRWMPMLENSRPYDSLIPMGARRHDFTTMSQMIGGAIIDFQGSNSPTALSSDPCSYVVQDETDKFSEGTKSEANASDLADQRTKGQALPKRIKTSTPTITEGLIWQALLQTDMRRRWVPCPYCGKFMVLIWSKNYTVFPIQGDEAEVVWDKPDEENTDSGDYLDRVARSARFECPHCAGHIRDEHKTRMDREGEWRPTKPASKGHIGHHLPSLYANTPETKIGQLALKFLRAKNSLLGLQGFINGDLAEPFENQDTRGERCEIITESIRDPEEDPDPIRMMSVDCQAKAPFFWYVIREWIGGNSLAIAAGPADTWEELTDIQNTHDVKDGAVIVDSGFGARSDADVYRNCCLHGEIRNGYHVGWLPSKGMPGRKRWRDKNSKSQPWHMVQIDPMMGTAQAGAVSMSLFEFSGDFFKDILEGLRQGRGDVTWGVHPDVDTDEYWRHLDGEVKTATRNSRTGQVSYQWQKRSRHWPNHMLDCEVMQIALANFFNLFAID